MIGVVKIGGAPGNRLEPLAAELGARCESGEKWVVVHGASGVMNSICQERGIEIRTITSPSGYSSRFVGERERALFEEAAGIYGCSVRDALTSAGVPCEEIKNAASAKRKDCIREAINGRVRMLRGNYSGTVTAINTGSLKEAFSRVCVPVVPPLATDTEVGLLLNVDGDRLAAAIAAALNADIFVVLSNVPGLLRDVNDPGSLVTHGYLESWGEFEHLAVGNMKRKLTACREALEGGVRRVLLADGRVGSPICSALKGGGTCLESARFTADGA